MVSCLSICIAILSADVPVGVGSSASTNSPITWAADYGSAMETAEASGKLTLLWFYDPKPTDENARFENEVLRQPRIATFIEEHFIPVKLPTHAVIRTDNKEIKLLEHGAFAEMLGCPGLAIIDMTEKDGPHHRQVVSIYPFEKQPISAERLLTLLELPRGSLTQRTLIFAVRTHAERPASAASQFSPILAHETESHANHQASITLQGHHNWENRFHAINAQLKGGLLAQEVCAESWPGQNLVEAAEECVHSWRQSPGHWQAVSGKSELFGYDMKKGRNGVWYAAGIFAHRH